MLAALSCISVLIITEIWVGAFASASYDAVMRGDAGYTYPPNLRGAYRNIESGELLRFSSNAEGFHDREWGPAAGMLTAVVTGNSFVDATQLAPERRFSSLAEAKLNSEGIPSRVLNLGIHGQAIMNHLDLALWAEKHLHPDVVVFVLTGAADFSATEQTSFHEGRRITYSATASGVRKEETSLEPMERWRRSILRGLRQRWLVRIAQQGGIQVLDWAHPKAEAETAPPLCPPVLNPASDQSQAGIHLTEAIVRDLHARLGDRLLVVLLPTENELAPPPDIACDWNRLDRWLETLAGDDIATLSLKPALAGPAPMFFPRGHLNRDGHRKVAEAIAGRIKTMPRGKTLPTDIRQP